MDKMKNMLPYLFVNIIVFYALPLMIKDTGSGMMILILGIPFFCFIASFVYGMKNAFNVTYVLLVVLLFIPTIFIFYNESANIYIFYYFVVVLVGSYLGSLCYKRNR